MLPTSDFLPAGGQGAVAIETLAGSPAADYFKRIDDADTAMRVAAEREFLYLLGAGCNTPVGVCANLETARGEMSLEAVVFDETNPENPPKTGKVSGACGDGRAMACALLQEMGIHIDM